MYAIGYCHKLSDDDRTQVVSFSSSEQEHLRNKPPGLSWDQSFLGILIAKQLCAHFLDLEEEDITITYNTLGRPCIFGANISISHSDDLVVCAVSKSPIGVDVERIRDDFPDLFQFCTPQEQRYLLESRDHYSYTERCCQIWTFKESYFKSLGSAIPDFRAVCMFDFPHLLQQFTIGSYYLSIFIHP